jgi:hypothetical protein
MSNDTQKARFTLKYQVNGKEYNKPRNSIKTTQISQVSPWLSKVTDVVDRVYIHNLSGFEYNAATQKLSMTKGGKTDWVGFMAPDEVVEVAERLESGESWNSVYESL